LVQFSSRAVNRPLAQSRIVKYKFLHSVRGGRAVTFAMDRATSRPNERLNTS